MTIGEAMTRLLATYLADFAVVAVFFLAAGMLIGCWIGVDWQQRRDAQPAEQVAVDRSGWLEQVLDEPVFTPGVAKVDEQ